MGPARGASGPGPARAASSTCGPTGSHGCTRWPTRARSPSSAARLATTPTPSVCRASGPPAMASSRAAPASMGGPWACSPRTRPRWAGPLGRCTPARSLASTTRRRACARIQEGVAALDGYGSIFRRNVALSGRVPQVSVVLGPCAGGAVYSPALTDFIIMQRDKAHMFVTGPRVVKAVTFEDVTLDELGGAGVHAEASGVAHLVADDAQAALALTRRLLSYLPSSCWDALPTYPPADPDEVPQVPTDHREPYDVRGVVRSVVDGGSFLEIHERFAPNVVVGFGLVDGSPVGVVANQPLVLAGCLDINASEKAARFVRTCDAFGLPIVTLVDVPASW